MMRMNANEAEQLLISGDPIQLGQLAGTEARKRFGDRITFIVDRNINYTCQYRVGLFETGWFLGGYENDGLVQIDSG